MEFLIDFISFSVARSRGEKLISSRILIRSFINLGIRYLNYTERISDRNIHARLGSRASKAGEHEGDS